MQTIYGLQLVPDLQVHEAQMELLGQVLVFLLIMESV